MFRQILEITVLNIRNLPARFGSSSVVVVGIGGVVGVLVAILAMGKGFESALDRAGAPDRAIVLRGGSSGELSSFMDTDAMNIVASMPEVTGSSGELFLIQDVPKRSNLSPANLAIRGVAGAAFDIHPEVQVVEGRRFETGTAELIAGRKAVRPCSFARVPGPSSGSSRRTVRPTSRRYGSISRPPNRRSGVPG